MNEIEQKEIEEMARIMANCNLTCDECFERLESIMTMKIKNRENHCQAYMFAKSLHEQGYRQCKDSVVLTRKKYREFLEMKRDVKNNKEYKIGSKETAEKILKEAKELDKVLRKQVYMNTLWQIFYRKTIRCGNKGVGV